CCNSPIELPLLTFAFLTVLLALVATTSLDDAGNAYFAPPPSTAASAARRHRRNRRRRVSPATSRVLSARRSAADAVGGSARKADVLHRCS
ncbi:unnamed protein product, partial [Urochloa humidicola]